MSIIDQHQGAGENQWRGWHHLVVSDLAKRIRRLDSGKKIMQYYKIMNTFKIIKNHKQGCN